MTSYEQIKQKIISTLMGRPAGTEILPENEQDYALSMLDYTRSLELISSSTLMGVAEATTSPVQPDNSRVCYIAGIGQNRTVTFQNFHDENGTRIAITTSDTQGVFVILMWNGEFWSYQSFDTNIISQSEQADYYYSYNIKKTYDSISLMNADKNSPIGVDGKYIKIGDIVTVINTTTPAENGIYSYQGSTSDFKFQSSFNFQIEQSRSQNANTSPSSKLLDDELAKQFQSLAQFYKTYNSNWIFQGFISISDNNPVSSENYIYKPISNGTYTNILNSDGTSIVITDYTSQVIVKGISSYSVQGIYSEEYKKNDYFPFASMSLVNSNVMLKATLAIKEAYITDYDSAYDYLFSVFRRNQLVSGTYYYEIRITKVQKGTTTTVELYNWQLTSASPIVYDEGDGLQLISLSNGSAYVIVDWNEIASGTGYGALSRDYLASERLGNLKYNKAISNFVFYYTKSEVDVMLIGNSFPFASVSLVNTDLLKQVKKSIKELYIPDYDSNYDYLFSVFRRNQLVSGTYYYDIRLGKVQKGTTTLVKYYQFTLTSASPIVYDEGDGLQLISLSNGGYILLDWNEVTEGTGYGELSTKYKTSARIGNLKQNPIIASTVANIYTKTETDAIFAKKTDVYKTSDVYSKTESNTNFASKSTTETQLSNYGTRLTQNENSIDTIENNVATINTALSGLSGSLPDGAINGDNSWLGKNIFTQAVKGVAAVLDNEYIRQGEYKNTLNRFEDAADYGFLPNETASNNVIALNAALLGGNKTLIISKPGEYLLNDMCYIDDNTRIICGGGVIFKKSTSFLSVLINRGALTHSYNNNIIINGLTINANQFDMVPSVSSSLYGLRGHLSMLCVNNLTITDFKCINYNTPQWALHVCSFNNFILDRFECRGNKDGVHLGRGDRFRISNGICETFDDAIALNAHDYTSCNPEVGDIKNGIIENIVDINKIPSSGYFSRILLGAWVNWYSGMNIRNGDTVVNNGRVYRAIGTQSTDYISTTEPVSTSFTETITDNSGFTWKLFQNDAVYHANIFNIQYKNIQGYNARVFVNVEVDTSGSYNRSLYPDVTPENYPTILKLKLKDCYLPASTAILSAGSMYDVEIDNIHGHNAAISLNGINPLTGIARALIKNCDFRNVTGNAIQIGSNVFAKIRDCQHNGNIAMTCSGRLDCNENITSFLSITPQKGDFVKVNNIPYYRGDSSWINLI